MSDGWLDLAVLDMLNDNPSFTLRYSGAIISASTPLVNAPLVIMNYVLDSLPTDAFKVSEEKTIREGLMTTYCTHPSV
jgi:hypothetical protein